jgi:hypothetical protein
LEIVIDRCAGVSSYCFEVNPSSGLKPNHVSPMLSGPRISSIAHIQSAGLPKW